MTAREATLAERCRIVDISTPGWVLAEFDAPKGDRTKYRCWPADKASRPLSIYARDWLWKQSLPRYPLEFWSEVLTYHIGAVVGVPVPPTFAALTKSGYGSLSLFVVNPGKGEQLIHGGDLLLGVDPNYDRERGRRHSVQLIRRALGSDLPRLYPEIFAQLVL